MTEAPTKQRRKGRIYESVLYIKIIQMHLSSNHSSGHPVMRLKHLQHDNLQVQPPQSQQLTKLHAPGRLKGRYSYTSIQDTQRGGSQLRGKPLNFCCCMVPSTIYFFGCCWAGSSGSSKLSLDVGSGHELVSNIGWLLPLEQLDSKLLAPHGQFWGTQTEQPRAIHLGWS